MLCDDCGMILTDEERQYYAGRCENCERAWHERIKSWRAGGEDAELDGLYSGKPKVLQ